MLKKCFIAGTPIQCEYGPKRIEELVAGDYVWSRADDLPDGEVILKRIDQVFVRHAQVLHIRIDSVTIGTTAEHPFWVLGKGWVDAQLLIPGDRLISQHGVVSVVREVANHGESATVYNFSVQDFHSYFVGCPEWGFDVWAHNYGDANLANGRIKGYTTHGLHQVIGRDGGRGVSPRAILDAVKNPKSIKDQRGGAIKYSGQDATVVTNAQGAIITAYAKGKAGLRGVKP